MIKFRSRSYPAGFLVHEPGFFARRSLAQIRAEVYSADFFPGVLRLVGRNQILCAPSHKPVFGVMGERPCPFVVTFELQKNCNLIEEVVVTGYYLWDAAEAFLDGVKTMARFEQSRTMGFAREWAARTSQASQNLSISEKQFE